MALILEAGAERYLDDRKIGPCEQEFGAFKALLHYILLRCLARRLSERTREMKRTQIRNRREIGQRDVVLEIRVDKLGDTL